MISNLRITQLNPSLIIFQCFEGVNFLFFSFQSVEFPSTFCDIFWLQIFVDFCSSVGTGYDRPRQEVSGGPAVENVSYFRSICLKTATAWNGNYTNDLCGVGCLKFVLGEKRFPSSLIKGECNTIHETGRFIYLHLPHESTKGRHIYHTWMVWYGYRVNLDPLPLCQKDFVFIPNNQRFMLRIQHKTHKNRISFLFNWPFAIQLT